MKQNHLYILDGSGSMSGLRKQAVEALNEYMTMVKRTAKEEGDEVYFSLLVFSDSLAQDDIFRYAYRNEKLSESSSQWTENDYDPYNMTPLYDAIGKGITNLTEKDAKEDMGNPDAKFFISIFTDGHENASNQFNFKQISKMIKHFNEDSRFDINFMGCGSLEQIKAYAQDLGVKSANTSNFTGIHDYSSKMMSYSTSITRKMKKK